MCSQGWLRNLVPKKMIMKRFSRTVWSDCL